MSASLFGVGREVAAQAYPTKPIRIVVPYSAGGPTDALARIVGQKLGERFGQNVVIDNRPGASGMIGADSVATAPPDGHTILINASLHVITPSLYEKMSHDPLNDFAPITDLGSVPLILVVNKDVPAQSVNELLALAKASPGKLTFASSGVGASSHLAGEMLKTMTGTSLSHVPYRGSAPALNDIIGGHISMMIDTSPGLAPPRPVRVAARPRRVDGATDSCAAGRADHRRGRRAGLRDHLLVRGLGAERHAEGDRR